MSKELIKLIKKLSFKKGDIVVAHYDLREKLSKLRLDIDFEVPVILTDDINKIKINRVAHNKF